MAFKTMQEYNDQRFNNFFLLRNNGDYADVIFLYRSEKDVLVADVHYIKSSDYSGYVHCCGKGCPACAKGIRVQNKLFIPLYNIQTQQIEFFDRSTRFDVQLQNDVLSKFPNPSEFVFRITRKGEAGDVNTTYQITAVGRNTVMSYDEILKSKGVTLPDHYSAICKEYSISEMSNLFNSPDEAYSGDGLPNYQVTPRVVASTIPEVPESANLSSSESFMNTEEVTDTSQLPIVSSYSGDLIAVNFSEESLEDIDNVDF